LTDVTRKQSGTDLNKPRQVQNTFISSTSHHYSPYLYKPHLPQHIMKISDRTFLISGGSSGLGLATAELLYSQGAYIALLDLNPPPSSSPISNRTATAFFTTDVSSTESIAAAVGKTVKWASSSKKPIGGVICCAGIGYAEKLLPRQPKGTTSATVKMMDLARFDRVLNINLRGTVDLIRQVTPHMSLNEPEGPDGERGVIIMVSSVAAFEGQVGQLAYSASKGAVRSIVLPLARELGQSCGVRVTAIAPGVFETGMTMKSKTGARTGGQTAAQKGDAEKKAKGVGAVNREMVNYPVRMGRGNEFARFCKEIIENPMLNGDCYRLDGGVRMPSRL
jgi:3-hydroxyacyl-CoA dehydrogenase/3-hydroxy-2-methylbutyryl-CoA dehydrogenase